MGLKINFPSTITGTISFAFLAVGMSAVLSMLVIQKYSIKTTKDGTEFIATTLDKESNADLNKNIKIKRIQFWSPSEETWNSLDSSHKTAENKWQIANKAKIDSFIIHVRKEFCSGVRAYPTFGIGQTFVKKGYWWTMTTNENFDINAFKEFYFKFWNTSKVFTEIYSNGGDYIYQKKSNE